MNKNTYIKFLNNKLLTSKDKDSLKLAVSYVEKLVDLGLPVIFDIIHLSKILDIEEKELRYILKNQEEKFYHSFEINKKNGGVRYINAPAKKLYNIQKWILDNILNKIDISESATGFCKKKSIVDNAKVHVNQLCIINIDIENFFTSISRKKVFGIFYYRGYTNYVSYILSRLCTYNEYLPQGAPTSPAISNIVCSKLDRRLLGLANTHNAKYTRYADDITFSASRSIHSIIPIVKRILMEEGFSINEKKTRILFKHQRQEVTGLIVNGDSVRVNRKYIKEFKKELYYCNKFGVSSHRQYTCDNKSFYKEHMYGKAEFIKSVDKELGEKLMLQLDQINWEG